MADQQASHWLRNHVAIAPFGSLLATAFLSKVWGSGGVTGAGGAADFAELGILVYGSVAVLVDRGANMIFWALEQKRKREEQRKAQQQEDFRARVFALLEEASQGETVQDFARRMREKESDLATA